MNSVTATNITTMAASAAPGSTGSHHTATPSQHAPSVVGSVLEASDGVGGKCYIRLQNISATGRYRCSTGNNRIFLVILQKNPTHPCI